LAWWGWTLGTRDALTLAASLAIVAVTGSMLYLFLRTHVGTAMRATGDNDQMMRALGVNVGNMLILGIALANGLSASPERCSCNTKASPTCRWESAWWCGAWRA
jgi:ABC-type uncharacterized transport system permease subunit